MRVLNGAHAAVMGLLLTIPTSPAAGQALGEPDQGKPGDAMIQAHLARVAEELQERFAGDLTTADEWTARRPEWMREYFYMLGLDPMPERTPLEATVTGTHEGPDYAVEKMHYQSRPGLYVTANLYRPKKVAEGQKLPGILYVCGHSGMGRDGNKAAFQSHGIWFARHGYVCLIVDTLQLGEIPGVHHGTYREGRWWWLSRGYTPAGVECWNGVRGIDYLVGRPDVDPERIAVTGISGGGAATFWIAAADERVKVAVPVSGMADLESYVTNRVVNGHCDCMFLYNTFEWPWTRIAGLIAPRPMLFVNSDQDAIFPMDANERISARLERLYSLFGAGDRFDTLVSVGGHAYRADIRQGAFRFLNTYLKDDPRPVTDGEVDAVAESSPGRPYPIPPEQLRAFPTDDNLPDDAINGSIDQHFVPVAKVEPPADGEYDAWREKLMGDLRRVTFRSLPERVPTGKPTEADPAVADAVTLEMEPGITVPLVVPGGVGALPTAKRVVLLITSGSSQSRADWRRWLEEHREEGDVVCTLVPRGMGPTEWTRRNPPNTVERSLMLLGRTADGDRVRDVAAAARYLKACAAPAVPVMVAGRGAAGVVGAFAAAFEPDIAGAVVVDPPSSHMDANAPVLLNVLRVLDVPEALGLLAPKRLVLLGADGPVTERVRRIFEAAGNGDHLDVR